VSELVQRPNYAAARRALDAHARARELRNLCTTLNEPFKAKGDRTDHRGMVAYVPQLVPERTREETASSSSQYLAPSTLR
jgi:hypothetical protein